MHDKLKLIYIIVLQDYVSHTDNYMPMWYSPLWNVSHIWNKNEDVLCSISESGWSDDLDLQVNIVHTSVIRASDYFGNIYQKYFVKTFIAGD